VNKIFACAIAAISLLAVTAPADAKGCIKGAVVVGAAGHLAATMVSSALPRVALSVTMRRTSPKTLSPQQQAARLHLSEKFLGLFGWRTSPTS
jgi:hypothetical protein